MSHSTNTCSRSTSSKKTLSIFPTTSLPHLPYQNMTSTTFTITSKPWLTNIIIIWKPLIITSLLCLQNLPIQVPRQTIKKNNSQIFHTKYQPMNKTSRNWASNKLRSSPCHCISHKCRPNSQFIKTALTNWASPTSINLKQKWKNMKR